MADLLQRFSGNPFSTSVGQRIEQATDPSMTSENWALNMEICDIINDTEDGARDAIRAIKKRLQQTAGKNFQVFKFTLIVLETCVKNCGKRFHILVSNKDFVQELVKLIGPKNDPPAEIQEKVLSLIQSWAEAFHGQPEMQGVSIVYNELRNKGIEFPKSTNEPKVPIYTPQRQITNHGFKNQESNVNSCSPKQLGSSSINNQTTTSSTAATTAATTNISGLYPIHLSPEQLNKLKIELEIVQGNMKVMSEMLTEMKPGQEHNDDWTLLIQLYQTLISMQKRIMDLIEKVANEEVTSELLRINDELNNLFMRFDRYQKKRGGNNNNDNDNNLIPSTSSKIFNNNKSSTINNQQSLIDFTDENDADIPDLIGNLKKFDINTTTKSNNTIKQPISENMGDKEFDVFAQSRSSTTSTTSTSIISQASSTLSTKPSSGSGLRPKDPAPLMSTEDNQEKEMEEIERWLNTKPGEPSMSFEAFLEKRANALDKQPLKKTDNNDQ